MQHCPQYIPDCVADDVTELEVIAIGSVVIGVIAGLLAASRVTGRAILWVFVIVTIVITASMAVILTELTQRR